MDERAQVLEKLDIIVAMVAKLHADMDVVKGDVAVLKGDVAVLKEDVSDLKGDLAELKTRMKAVELEIVKLHTAQLVHTARLDEQRAILAAMIPTRLAAVPAA